MPEVTMMRVFPGGPEGGNPTPIVTDAEGLTDEEMLGIAARHGLESCFILPPSDGVDADYRFRFFVPNHEMEMCGHATIGALWMMRGEVLIWRADYRPGLRIETLSGIVEAEVPRDGLVSISQPAGEIAPLSGEEAAAVLDVLGLAEADLAEPVPVNARTSRTKTLIALKDVTRLHALAPDFGRIEELCRRIGSTGLYPFAMGRPATEDGPDAGQVIGPVAHARQFPMASGYPEDAATGIAATALAFGLLHWGTVSPDGPLTVRQGEAMGRASELYVTFDREGQGGEEAVTGCRLLGACCFMPEEPEGDSDEPDEPDRPDGIGPHECRELELMLAGEKPLAMFYDVLVSPVEVIPEAAFAPHVAAGTIIRREVIQRPTATALATRYVYFALPGEEWRIDAMREIQDRIFIRKERTTPETEREIGRLLGYPEKAIDAYLSRFD